VCKESQDMTKLDSHKHVFPHAKLTRSAEGILEVVLHTDGDTLVFNGHTREGFHREGKKVLASLLDIAVPVIAALNGPTTVHSEYVLLCDIVIATPDTVFQDKPHFSFGIVPGDGIHSLWPDVIGPLRGRYFGRERLLQLAREIAAGIAKLPPSTVSYTRVALTQPLRRLIDENVGYELALEGISAADLPQSRAAY
jgi:enoyl-CoA hydratase/carnithine racemase